MSDQSIVKTVVESGLTAIILTTLLGIVIRRIFGGIWDTLKDSASKTDLNGLRVSVNKDIEEMKEKIAEHAEKNTAQYIELIKAIAELPKK